jgi:FlaA1/EpsC-like NDP-sugar epimerase
MCERLGVIVTDPDCTRFWMRIQRAVELVMQTIFTMQGGEVIIPDLPAFRLGDLAEAMDKPMLKPVGLPAWEKKHESMDATRCSETAPRMTVDDLRQQMGSVYADISTQGRPPAG